jgi:hypothetical protein
MLSGWVRLKPVLSAGDTVAKRVASLQQDPRHLDDPDRALSPFPLALRDDVKRGRTNAEINEAIEAAPVERVRLEGLKGIQESVSRRRVASYMRRGWPAKGTRSEEHGGLVDLPIVVEQRGVKYLWDGHHRCVAALLRGDVDARARVVRLPEVESKSDL